MTRLSQRSFKREEYCRKLVLGVSKAVTDAASGVGPKTVQANTRGLYIVKSVAPNVTELTMYECLDLSGNALASSSKNATH